MKSLEFGDKFESIMKDCIREKLPFYEKVWKEFIGHDGHGSALSISSLTSSEEVDRSKFAQAHYTMAISAFILDTIDLEPIDLLAAENIDNFLREYRRLMEFMLYVGIIRDMFTKMDEALRAGGEICKPLQELYHSRSNVLHGAKIPMRLDEISIKIPIIAGSNEVDGEWTSKAIWEQVPFKDWKYISDYLKEVNDELFQKITEASAKLYGYAKNRFRNSVDWEYRTILSTYNPPASASGGPG